MRLRLTARLAYSVAHCRQAGRSPADPGRIEPEIAAAGGADRAVNVRDRPQSIAIMEDRFGRRCGRREASAAEPAQRRFAAFMTDTVIIESLTLQDDFDAALQMAETCIAAAQRMTSSGLNARSNSRGAGYWAAAGRLDDAAAVLEGVSPTLEPYQVGNAADAAVLAALGRAALHTGNRWQSETCARIARLAMSRLPPEPRQHAAWLLALQQMAAGDARAARAVLTEGRDRSCPCCRGSGPILLIRRSWCASPWPAAMTSSRPRPWPSQSAAASATPGLPRSMRSPRTPAACVTATPRNSPVRSSGSRKVPGASPWRRPWRIWDGSWSRDGRTGKGIAS